ncbi:MAG: hypothetical protein PHV63_02545 [Candidatus Daviesbacteria bacterium]|nr:hypothetical protein [Candidatus Daviesbacteria bacterium]
MKKIIALASTITALSMPVLTFAADEKINISPPPYGYKSLGGFVTNLITIAFSVAILTVLVMLIWGAFEWIVSGGDKEAVGKARNRILNALIGLAVLAIAFALATVGAQILGFPDITSGLPIPTPPPK